MFANVAVNNCVLHYFVFFVFYLMFNFLRIIRPSEAPSVRIDAFIQLEMQISIIDAQIAVKKVQCFSYNSFYTHLCGGRTVIGCNFLSFWFNASVIRLV